MQVTSFRFLLFVAVVLALQIVFPLRRQWVLLLAASLFFYAQNGMKHLLLLLLSVAFSYCTARRMAHNRRTFDRQSAKVKNRKWLLWWLVGSFGVLAVCKIRLTLQQVLLPMGISFYLFQSAGYVLDVYHGEIPAEQNPWKLALFVCYFPQMVQGPIGRFHQLAPQLLQGHPRDAKRMAFGVQRMIWGYFKKLVIADRIAVAVAVLREPTYTGRSFWLLTLFYAVQIYGDFTGGIDIVLGLSEAMGVTLPENFHHPFFSKNVAQFWRRWHITLGEWMKTYIFYPVSVSAPMRRLGKAARKRWGGFGKRLPVYLATLLTWFCTGIWHGLTPNFLLWGMMNCAVIVASEELAPLYRKFHSRFHLNQKSWYGLFEMLRTFVLMNLIRVCDLFPKTGDYLARLRSAFSGGTIPLNQLGLSVTDWWILALGCLLMLAVSTLEVRKGSIREMLWKHPGLRDAAFGSLVLIILLMGCYGIGYDAKAFIYNQF